MQLVYDTQDWLKQWISYNCVSTCNPSGYYIKEQNPNVASGWRVVSSLDWGVDFLRTTVTCPTTGIDYDQYTNWVVIDPQGTRHPLALREEVGTRCNGQTLSGPTLDGSGFTYDISSGTIRAKDGTIVSYNIAEDPNGNQISATTDSLGRTPYTVTTGPTITYTTPLGQTAKGPQYTKYTITDSNGTSETYEIDYQAVDEMSDICAMSGLQLSPAMQPLGGIGGGGGGGGFGTPNCTDGDFPTIVDKQIILPDGKAYVFTYANNTPGDLARIDLPTGASISYTYGDYYQTQYGSGGPNPSSSGGRSVATRTVTVNGVSNTWTYAIGPTSTVTDPLGNKQIHSFSQVIVGSGGLTERTTNHYETQVVYQDSQGITLKTVKTDYTGNADYVNNTVINVRPIRKTIILDNGMQSKEETDYETFAYNCPTCDTDAGGGIATRLNPTEVRQYDYGASAPGPLLKRTDFTYLHTSNPNYVNLNIVNRVTSVTTYDGSGTQVAKLTNEFDNYNHPNQPMVASNAVQHDLNFGTGYTTRGNITATSVWRNTDGAMLTTTYQYDDAGNKISVIDPGGHKTTYDYTDNWSNVFCAPPGQSKAFVTHVTNAKGQITTTQYNSCSGTAASVTDANLKTTSTTYGLMDRVKQIVNPDQGTKTFCYSDDPTGSCNSSTLFMTEVDSLSPSVSRAAKSIFDGLGRVTQTQLTSDLDGTVYVDTQYDQLGRAYKVSNPYRAVDTEYWTTTSYDALGRVEGVAKPDGSASSITYSGNTILNTDEAGKQRKSQTDALGRLTAVWEDPGGLNYETDYQYDTLGDVTTITQKGGDSNSADWRVRTFTYNSLKQLVCAANPEIGAPGSADATCPTTDTGSYIPGTTRYQYNSDSELTSKTAPLHNQSGSSSVTITYTYDSLHRLTGKSYTDGTVAVGYAYDGDPLSMCAVPALSAANSVGHMTAMCDGSGASAWNYDPMGRTTTEVRRIGTVTDQIGYTYYYDGTVKTVSYPSAGAQSPFVLTYNINAAGRTYSAVGSDQVTYAEVSSTWASGASRTWQLGSSIQLEDSYNARLQPLQSTASKIGSGNTLFSRTYDFHAGSGDNGLLYGVMDGLDQLGLNRPNGSVNYSYDALNRLSSAATTGSDCTAEPGGTKDWGESYTVDAWGNLRAKTVTKCTAESLSVLVDSRNRLSTAGYDSAGNVVSKDGVSYSYDAEGQVVSAGGVVYTYDGNGERVKKPGRLYWGTLMETDENDRNPVTYIFFNGKRIARIDPGATAKYYVSDNIGSTALVTDAAGNVLNESLYFPYGGERVISANDAGNRYKYTGKERDTETGNDYFGARYYASNIGRFLTPDWNAKPVTVPYASFGDPQTLNLYAYVENAPLNRVDADGHWAAPPTDSPAINGGSAICDICEPSQGFGYGLEIIPGFGFTWDGFIPDSAKQAYEVYEAMVQQSTEDLRNQGRQQGLTPQSLTAQIPRDVREQMVAAINDSNSPTADDKAGGFHEEYGVAGTNASGHWVVSRDLPGPYENPDVSTTVQPSYKPKDQSLANSIVSPEVFFHVHPSGRTATHSWVQRPSQVDIEHAVPGKINIVFGAGNGRVYFYNNSGPIGRPMKLKDFLGQ